MNSGRPRNPEKEKLRIELGFSFDKARRFGLPELLRVKARRDAGDVYYYRKIKPLPATVLLDKLAMDLGIDRRRAGQYGVKRCVDLLRTRRARLALGNPAMQKPKQVRSTSPEKLLEDLRVSRMMQIVERRRMG